MSTSTPARKVPKFAVPLAIVGIVVLMLEQPRNRRVILKWIALVVGAGAVLATLKWLLRED